MRRLLVLLSLLGGPALAQTAPIANSINTTNAGQATGTVLNSNQQINQMPVMQQEFGAGFRCQNSTLSFSPYVVNGSTSYGIGSATGVGGLQALQPAVQGRPADGAGRQLEEPPQLALTADPDAGAAGVGDEEPTVDVEAGLQCHPALQVQAVAAHARISVDQPST
jgi:hypothetical protein